MDIRSKRIFDAVSIYKGTGTGGHAFRRATQAEVNLSTLVSSFLDIDRQLVRF